MERKTELKSFQVDYICDSCKNGKMKFLGSSYLTAPPLYPHVCENCNWKSNFKVIYPTITHEPVKSDDQA